MSKKEKPAGMDDNYIEDVIEKGDKGSDILAEMIEETLDNSEFTKRNGLGEASGLIIPEDYLVVVHSVGADSSIIDLKQYSASLVDRLVEQAKILSAKPIAFANVIDSKEGDLEMLRTIKDSLVERANYYHLAILNGENALLGERVNCDANLSGTMISLIKRTSETEKLIDVLNLSKSGINYAVFDHEEKPVTINSDGVGTKTEFYERAKTPELAIEDFLAMNIDDAIKQGAEAKVVLGVVETKGNIPIDKIHAHAGLTGIDLGIHVILQHEEVNTRIKGYNEDVASYNISGSVVSIIDEERLKNPLKPSEGEYLIAVTKRPNPRSNGITGKRKAMIQMLGENWHETEKGKEFLEYLATPSTILYPLFKQLIDNNLATSIYHMSGGAFKGKLAKPLAKHGLFVEITDLFQPDYREIEIMNELGTTAEEAYEQWPMGHDGFITTKNPEKAIAFIQSQGYQATQSGKLEKTDKTGVELTAFNKEKIYFSGK